LWPGVADLLTDLRQAGSKLAILTNGLHETHREKIALLGVEPLVDGIYISDEIGMAKPDPKVFELVCRELGVEPANATMVGDRYSRDISGALAVGMKTIFLDLRAEEIPIGSPGPDLTVKDIQTAAEALRASLPA
jgi:putative hydrolase of the HAD superfamily